MRGVNYTRPLRRQWPRMTRFSHDRAAVLALSWWMIFGHLVERDVAELIMALEACLPEALPGRYGSFEPPEFKYAESGREHFLRLVREGAGPVGFVVWYPHPPIASVRHHPIKGDAKRERLLAQKVHAHVPCRQVQYPGDPSAWMVHAIWPCLGEQEVSFRSSHQGPPPPVGHGGQ